MYLYVPQYSPQVKSLNMYMASDLNAYMYVYIYEYTYLYA